MKRTEKEALVYSAMSARLPWLSPDAEFSMVYTMDSQEQIDQCCRCTREHCVNCIAGGKQSFVGSEKKADISVFAQLVRDGLSVSQICEALGIKRSTFYNYRNQLSMKGAIA